MIWEMYTTKQLVHAFINLFVGFKVIETSVLTDIDNRHASERTTLIVSDPPFRVSVQVEGAVSHLSLSCDELTLAVVVTLDGIVQIYVYDVRGFTNQVGFFLSFLLYLKARFKN